MKEAPKKVEGLKYTSLPQALVSEGEAENGNMEYSLDGINYSYDIPTGTDAKTYTVWYKAVATDKNHEDSTPDTVTGITISPNTDTPQVFSNSNPLQQLQKLAETIGFQRVFGPSDGI